MGQTLSRKQTLRILMVGLDGAGKTSLLHKIQLGRIVTTIPTIGFHVKKSEDDTCIISSWDVGGHDMWRRMIAWRNYCPDAQHGLIFVVDGNDRGRIAEARPELHRMLNEDKLRDAVLLVFANKQDLLNSMSVAEIIDKLGLLPLRRRCWRVYLCSAATGEGMYDGLDWLNKSLAYKHS